jgi:exodeoxyribonuclease-3
VRLQAGLVQTPTQLRGDAFEIRPRCRLFDYNVMPTDLDVYKPERWQTDALRTLHPDERVYTFWDYFRNAYARNAGLRIDHLLLTPDLAKRLKRAEVDTDVRGWEKTSDHAPVWIELKGAKAKT